MSEGIESLLEQVKGEHVAAVAAAAGTLIVGLILARLARAAARSLTAGRLSAHGSILAGRAAAYTVASLAALAGLHRLGIDLSLLIGAAGILTVALGFASQTSVSNIISGLFLVAEKPFEIGQTIRVSGISGEVLAIDLLSIKLRTFDNLFVRIPNETLLKSEIVNVSRFPIRRIDVGLTVGFQEDLAAVEALLRTVVVKRSTLCLSDPRPLFLVQGFGDAGIQLQFSVWATQKSFFEAKNQVYREILAVLGEAGVEIPLPRRVLSWRDSSEEPPVLPLTP
jgi:small-conductance mechanosensitive channel